MEHILKLSWFHNSCQQNFCVTKCPKTVLFFQFHIPGTVGPISKNEAQSSSTDQGARKKVDSPARNKGLISNDKCQTCQGIHQDRQKCTKPGPSRKTQLLDPCLLGQILEDGE